MAIKKFHDLPHAQPVRDDGTPPDGEVRFGHILVERWAEQRAQLGPKPRAREEARFRHSDANACARAVAFAALDLPSDKPMDMAGVWITELGTKLHEAWQDELERRFPEAEIEVVVGTGVRAGHIDALLRIPEGDAWRKVVIECKSIGGYAFQLAVGARGAAEGPRSSAIVQCALNAHDADADEMVVIYWARDAISIQVAARKGIGELGRFVAEWTWSREEYEPIALAEIARVEAIVEMVNAGMLPARKIPELGNKAVIVRPRDGAWVEFGDDGQAVNAGTTFHCLYCRFQEVCATTGPHRQPIPEELRHVSDDQTEAPPALP